MAVQTPSRWATDNEAVADLLARIRTWTPLDGDALLDDVASVLDDVPPSEDETEEIAERLRGHLMQLVHIATANGIEEKSAYGADLVQRARTLRVEEVPGDHRQGILHLRQLGWATNELLDQLVALKFIKEAA